MIHKKMQDMFNRITTKYWTDISFDKLHVNAYLLEKSDIPQLKKHAVRVVHSNIIMRYWKAF